MSYHEIQNTSSFLLLLLLHLHSSSSISFHFISFFSFHFILLHFILLDFISFHFTSFYFIFTLFYLHWDDLSLFTHRNEGIYRLLHLLGGMGGTQLHPDAGSSLGHYRVAKPNDIYTFFKHIISEI